MNLYLISTEEDCSKMIVAKDADTALDFYCKDNIGSYKYLSCTTLFTNIIIADEKRKTNKKATK